MTRHRLPAVLRSLFVLLGLILFTGWASPASAGFVDYDITHARLALQRADYLLGDAQWAADVARDDFERADRRAADLARDIDRQQRDLDDISRRFDEAERAAKWLREDLARWQDKAAASRKDVDAAGEKLRAAREALDKLTADAVAQFEAGDDFKKLKNALDEAGKALDAAEKASLEAFSQTDEHRAAATEVAARKTRLEFLADQGDRAAPDEVETATKELAGAQDRLRRVEDRHLSDDPQVKDAERRVAQAQQALKSLRDDFDKQLGQRPEVAAARKAADAQQQAYDDALRAAGDADARVADARKQLADQEEVAALEQDKLRAANDNLNRLLDEVHEADDFAASSQRRLADATEAVECARRERDAASWALARAERADAFYCWDAPAYGYGWTVVHVGRVDCAPRPLYRPVFGPVFVDPDCYRPSWCRPLADFHQPSWGLWFGFHYGNGWYHHGGNPHGWHDDHRPVVVKVVRTPNVAVRRTQETAREHAIRLAGRSAGDEQRQQREAVVKQRRSEVQQRQVRLAAFGAQAGSQGAAAISIRQSNAIERETRRQAAEAERNTRLAANRAELARGSEAKQAADANAYQMRLRQAAEMRERERLYQSSKLGRPAPDSLRQGAVQISPANPSGQNADGKRLRWAERRDQDEQQRAQRLQARQRQEREADQAAVQRAAAVAGRPVPLSLDAKDDRREDRDQRAAAKQANAPERPQPEQSQQELQQQRRAERETAQKAKAQQDAADRTARQQAEAARRQAAQADRQQDADARRQRQADDAAREAQRDAARDAQRQQAAAEERSRRAAERTQAAQREAQRDTARESQRQAEHQRSAERAAEREASRAAERQARQAADESRRSEQRQERTSDRPSDRSNDRSGDRFGGDSGGGRRR